MKGREAHSTKTKHKEHNFGAKSSKDKMLGKLSNDNNFYSSSTIPLKFKAKLEIPMFNGKTNAKSLDRWLKQLEAYIVFYQI
jgi:hypothetical protein